MGQIVQTALLAFVALAIAFGVLRPLLTRVPAALNVLPGDAPAAGLPAPAAAELAPNGLLTATEAAETGGPASASPSPDGPASLPPLSQMGSAFDDALPMMMSGALSPDAEHNLEDLDPVERLRLLIHEREDETVQILRSWMNEDEEAAG